MVYSFGFTDKEALSTFLSNKTNFQWGFKIGTPSKRDNKLDWRLRMKALQVMVPFENEEVARSVISDTFKQHPEIQQFKKFADCYLFVGNEREHRSKNMKTIFETMISRHDFRITTGNIIYITSIVKDIDTYITTKHKVELTLREMVLNIPSKENEFGSQFLFQSIDYTTDYSKVWWKNIPGEGGSGYILTYFDWDEDTAIETARGLGAYLGKIFGKTGIFPYFSADHWKAVKDWKWNETERLFNTLTQLVLANNVLHDPTAKVMEKYYSKIEEAKRLREDQMAKEPDSDHYDNEDSKSQEGNNSKEKSSEVQDLANRDNKEDDNDNDETWHKNMMKMHRSAIDIAQSISSQHDVDSGENSSSSSDLSNTEESTHTNLFKQQAANTIRAQFDPDLDSLPEIGTKQKDINNVVQLDNMSVASSITDVTNNTANGNYHHLETTDKTIGSRGSASSLESFNTKKNSQYVSQDMSTEEAEDVIETIMRNHRLTVQVKANEFLNKLLKDKRLQANRADKNNKNESPVKGTQKGHKRKRIQIILLL